MPSLLLFVVFLTIVTTLISTLGAPAVNQLLWTLYTRLPTPLRSLSTKNAALRHEVLQLRTQLSGISSQDNFARWAKIRRNLDKKTADLEACQSQLTAIQTAFNSRAGILRWVMTTGVRTFIFFWFSKQPIFWMPKGAVPSYVEWGLSFPRAPQGSVSIQVWSFAVGQMVTLLFAVTGWIVGSFGTRTGQPTEPMKMESKTEAKKAQ